DEIGQPIELDDLTVEDASSRELVTHDVRLEERLQESARVDGVVTVDLFQRAEPLDHLTIAVALREDARRHQGRRVFRQDRLCGFVLTLWDRSARKGFEGLSISAAAC